MSILTRCLVVLPALPSLPPTTKEHARLAGHVVGVGVGQGQGVGHRLGIPLKPLPSLLPLILLLLLLLPKLLPLILLLLLLLPKLLPLRLPPEIPQSKNETGHVLGDPPRPLELCKKMV